jgi:hypothetical protein
LNNEDFGAAHVLADLDAGLFVFELGDERLADMQLQAFGDLFREAAVGVAAEE